MRPCKVAAILRLSAAVLMVFMVERAVAAGGDASPPPVDPAKVCAAGQVIPRKLVNHLLDRYNDTSEPEQVLKQLSDPRLRAAAVQQHTNWGRILLDTTDMLNGRWSKQFQPKSVGAIDGGQYFENPSADPILCVSNPTSTAAPETAQLRIRGTPDDLIFKKGEDGFTGASKATLSFSDNGGNKTRTDQLQATVGYALPLGSTGRYTAIPYVATNRNVSNTSGKPVKFNTETVDVGIGGVAKDLPFSGATFSLTPDYLMNLQDDSRLASLHPILTPHFIGMLNNPANLGILFTACTAMDQTDCGSWPYFTLLADVRSDLGTYTDRGSGTASARAANQDFTRLGSRFGFELFLKNWYDLAVTHTYLHGFTGTRRSLNDFQSSFSFYFGSQNVVGLTVAYKNGLLEQTAQREQSWTVGLSAKY